MEKERILVVTGPTGSGKSALALDIARRVGGEIVCADSMQVYRGFDIGTAKPTPAERDLVPHHLIDVAEPGEAYQAGRFRADALAAIADIRRRGKPCLVVGGTALYIKVLLEGLVEGPVPDLAERAALTALWEAGGAPELWEELKEFDPATAARLHPNDKSRIIRALEVYRTTGSPLSLFQRAHGFADRRFHALILGMAREREELYSRIDARVEWMMAAGWVEEVRRLLDAGLSPDLNPLKAIGYLQIVEHLTREAPMDETVATIKKVTRQFSKRQMTWLRKMDIEWVSPDESRDVFLKADDFFGRRPSNV